jgi:hypothetical protein
MTDIKYCKRCGAMISDINNTDWYRHMSVKYCSFCRKESDRQKTALRVYNLRQRKKEKDKFRDEQLELLKVENELLRKRVLKLREETENLQ